MYGFFVSCPEVLEWHHPSLLPSLGTCKSFAVQQNVDFSALCGQFSSAALRTRKDYFH